MISKPTNQQLIEAVCAELTGKVAPNITDAGTKVVLEMALSVLSCAAVRTAKELAWMKEESDAIEVVARRFAEDMPDAEALSAALAAYDAGRTGSLYLDGAQADYELISEVLSCATDAAFASGDRRASPPSRSSSSSEWPTRTPSPGRSSPSAGPEPAAVAVQRPAAAAQRPTTAGLPSVQRISSVRCTMRQPSGRRANRSE